MSSYPGKKNSYRSSSLSRPFTIFKTLWPHTQQKMVAHGVQDFLSSTCKLLCQYIEISEVGPQSKWYGILINSKVYCQGCFASPVRCSSCPLFEGKLNSLIISIPNMYSDQLPAKYFSVLSCRNMVQTMGKGERQPKPGSTVPECHYLRIECQRTR